MGAFDKVAPGDPQNIPAEAYNAFIDAALAHKRNGKNPGGRSSMQPQNSGVVTVCNASGAGRNQFDVLGIDSPVFTPTANLDEFKQRVLLNGVTPATASHVGKFAILLEPVPTGVYAKAVVAGAAIVKVNVADAGHQYADVADGQCGYLASGTSGAAMILWKESGTGEKWAVVRIGAGGGGTGDSISTIPVKLSASNGSGSYTGKEQTWTGSAWTDKEGASNITAYNLFETTDSGMSAVDVTGGPVVLVTNIGGRYFFERETNAFYKS